MRVLVIGGGGREHALVWKLSQSPKITALYCAPGNAGIGQTCSCVDIAATDLQGLLRFVEEEKIDFTVVGMDDPLMLGIVDLFREKGHRIFGPTKKAALIEGSKAFSKDLMKKYKIPTAGYEVFEDSQRALDYVGAHSFPLVVKADGLALGKGVLICENLSEAEQAVREIMEQNKFGEAGNRVVIEEFLTGQEVSVLAFCDGVTVVPMVSAQDHKRALDGDQGLNTGGMGTFSPSRIYTKEMEAVCMDKIFQPTMDALREEGRPFQGILYFGLMVTAEEIKVLEYNARFGDPETQVVLPRLQGDLLEIMEACVDGRLHECPMQWTEDAAVCVILASGGYPESYQKGYPIIGLEQLRNKENIFVFHAGTAQKDGVLVTNGGRVLGITAVGKDLEQAIHAAYAGVEAVSFEQVHYRKDIGIK